MKVALIQVASPDTEPAAERLRRVAARVSALPGDPDLIVLPELWTVGFNHFDDYATAAETLDGPLVRTFAELAAERRCLVHAGSIVRRDRGSLWNTAVLIGPDGMVLHTFDKVHIFGYKSREIELLSPGRTVQAVDTRFGVMAGTTCYDLRFPGLWTQLVGAGAEIVIVPAAWPSARLTHWRLMTEARAVDNQVFVIACNAVGTHGGVELGGRSRIVDPSGQVVTEAGTDEDVTTATIDTTLVARTRTEFPVLADRLDDYSILNTAGPSS